MAKAEKDINLLRSDGEKVQTFLELCTAWKEWNRINNDDVPTKMFYVMYGWFDENPNWIKNMEEEYMVANNLQYSSNILTQQTTENKTSKKLDTISMLISIVKNDCVKLINKRTIQTHNMKLTILEEMNRIHNPIIRKEERKLSVKNHSYHNIIY